jgi:hypothetical protein
VEGSHFMAYATYVAYMLIAKARIGEASYFRLIEFVMVYI